MSNHKASSVKASEAVRTLKRGVTRTVLAALLLATTVALVPAVAADAATSPIRVTGAGDLIVTGTNNPRDEISVSQNAPGTFRILVDTAGDIAEYNVEDVTRNVTFNMRGGDDIIYLDSYIKFSGDLTIRWGSGRSSLTPRGGFRTQVEGNLTVLDGSGESRFLAENFRVRGRTRLSLGGGEAEVTIEDSRFTGDFTASISNTGQFSKFDAADAMFGRKFSVNGGNKSDTVNVANSYIAGLPKVNLRGGDDRLEITEALLDGRTNITLGSGDDIAYFSQATFAGVFSLRADGGDDHVTTFASNFRQRTTLNGGGGTDRIFGQTTTFAVTPRILSFES